MADPSNVAIVTDSTSDLPPDMLARLGITMVPLNLYIGDESFKDQVDLTTDEFLQHLKATPELISTAQPSSGDFEAVFRHLAQDHDEIVCVLLSSRLAGSVQSARAAAEAVKDVVHVEVVDSLNGSMGLGYQVLAAHELATSGQSAHNITETIRSRVDNYHVIFFVETLDHLRRGGRIGKAASLVGSVLQLKPLLHMDEGQVVPFERTRTRKRAIEALVEVAEHLPEIEHLTVLHNTTPEDAEALYQRVRPFARRESPVPIATFGPALSTHVGPGTLGLAIEVTAHDE